MQIARETERVVPCGVQGKGMQQQQQKCMNMHTHTLLHTIYILGVASRFGIERVTASSAYMPSFACCLHAWRDTGRERETDLCNCAAAGVGVRKKRTDACNAREDP